MKGVGRSGWYSFERPRAPKVGALHRGMGAGACTVCLCFRMWNRCAGVPVVDRPETT